MFFFFAFLIGNKVKVNVKIMKQQFKVFIILFIVIIHG